MCVKSVSSLILTASICMAQVRGGNIYQFSIFILRSLHSFKKLEEENSRSSSRLHSIILYGDYVLYVWNLRWMDPLQIELKTCDVEVKRTPKRRKLQDDESQNISSNNRLDPSSISGPYILFRYGYFFYTITNRFLRPTGILWKKQSKHLLQ